MNILVYLNHNQNFEFLIEKERKKNKVLAVNFHKKDVSLSTDKIYASFSLPVSTLEAGIEEIARMEAKKNLLKDQMDVASVYQLLSEESEGIGAKEIASFVFEEASIFTETAVYEKLCGDKIYFKQKNALFYPKNKAEVEENLKKIEAEKQKTASKEELEEKAVSWIIEKIEKKIEDPAVPQNVLSYVNLIRNFCIFGDDFQRKSQALELLQILSKKTGFGMEGNQVFAAFKFLKELGIFQEDENLLLQKYSITQNWAEEELSESKKIELEFQLQIQGRKDFRDIYTFSIDDKETKDIDDALSFYEKDGKYFFMIHISDVGEVLDHKNILEESAFRKTSSIYLPDFKLPMLPENLSENICSLKENTERYVLSYIIETDKDYQIINKSIEAAVAHIHKNLTYEEVNEILENPLHEQNHYFQHFYHFAKKFQGKRLSEWKGIEFAFPSVNPKIVDDEIVLKYYDPFSKSGLIVKEMMILANYISAAFLKTHDIPAVYISQDEPDEELYLSDRIISNKAEFQEIVRFMKKAFLSTLSKGHFALVLPCYTQATSPIRRYLDLFTQRQIKHYLKTAQILYQEEEVLDIKVNIENLRPVIAQIESETNQYWLLKYLLIHQRNKVLDATVNKILPDGSFLAEIHLTRTVSKIIAKTQASPGQNIKVKLHTIIPRLNLSLGNIV